MLLVKYAEFFIEVGICDDRKNEQWRLFAVHASTNHKKRKDHWRVLSQCIAAKGDKCLVIGDFNDIFDDSENKGGNYRSVVNSRDFCDFIVVNGLLDFKFVGYPFTWRNRRDEGLIQQ